LSFRPAENRDVDILPFLAGATGHPTGFPRGSRVLFVGARPKRQKEPLLQNLELWGVGVVPVAAGGGGAFFWCGRFFPARSPRDLAGPQRDLVRTSSGTCLEPHVDKKRSGEAPPRAL